MFDGELTGQALSHVVLEQATQVANAWRNYRWVSFILVTPHWILQLLGLAYRNDNRDGFASWEVAVGYLDRYAALSVPRLRRDVWGISLCGLTRPPTR